MIGLLNFKDYEGRQYFGPRDEMALSAVFRLLIFLEAVDEGRAQAP